MSKGYTRISGRADDAKWPPVDVWMSNDEFYFGTDDAEHDSTPQDDRRGSMLGNAILLCAVSAMYFCLGVGLGWWIWG